MELTQGVRLAWQLGANETVAAHKQEIGPIQFFCAATKILDWLSQPESLAALVPNLNLEKLTAEVSTAFDPLIDAGLDPTGLRRRLRAHAGKGQHEHAPEEVIHRSEPLRELFQQAAVLADRDQRQSVSLADIVCAMLADPQLVVSRTLAALGVEPGSLIFQTENQIQGSGESPGPRVPGTPALDQFGRDLTALARAGKLGPVIGRREELLSMIRTLARRSKNNPVLIGEPGVGKTAVVELLAVRLAEGKHQDILGERRIVELQLANLFSGAKLVGEREERLEAIVKECRENPDVLLFIDELHTLVQAGGQPGAVDPKDVFKPALARGEIRCIGATTLTEYDAYIAPDAALERRFDPIMVVEPTADETLEILKGLAPNLTAHHGLEIPDETLKAAVDLSVQYDGAHQLPDKAIDLIDKAAALARVPALSVAQAAQPRPARLDRDAVIQALTDKLGLPQEALGDSTAAKPHRDLEAALTERILGQTDAIRVVAERLRLADAGLQNPDRPRAVFFFAGSTGTGKTEMARALADSLFDGSANLIRIDLSEYMEPHDAYKLIGAPPGYIGHDEPGQLTGQLRAKPYSVVLLDEADKAHPRVLDLLLQVFDAGHITDAKGRTIDARHAVFVLTANVPAEHVPHRIGFGTSSARPDDAEDAIAALKSRFRPEFLNRINAIIVFRPLNMTHTRILTERYIEQISRRIQDRYGIQLSVASEVVDHLAKEGHSPEYGVRELQRVIERRFDGPLSALLVSATVKRGGQLNVVLSGSEIKFEASERH